MNAAQHVLIFAVRLYRWTLSPAMAVVFGPLARCRFTPTCSEYAMEAVRIHGALRGSWLALKRLGRCQPWGGCGHDPVPPNQRQTNHSKPTGMRCLAEWLAEIPLAKRMRRQC